jgi:hypothetical protein
MPLPQTVRVKLSSEAAEAITITPVVVQDMPLAELVEHMLGVAGKDEARIREILQCGTLVSGASRFRWAGLEAEAESMRDLLAALPDPDPSRPFEAARCLHAVLTGGRSAVELPREALETRSLFRRASFWDALMGTVSAPAPEYAGYSYRDRADRYVRRFSPDEIARVRALSAKVRYSTLRDRIASVAFTAADLYAAR